MTRAYMHDLDIGWAAAPHNNWSPTLNADKYSPPIASFRKRPTGVVKLPVTTAGESAFIESSLWFGMTLTQSFASDNI